MDCAMEIDDFASKSIWSCPLHVEGIPSSTLTLEPMEIDLVTSLGNDCWIWIGEAVFDVLEGRTLALSYPSLSVNSRFTPPSPRISGPFKSTTSPTTLTRETISERGVTGNDWPLMSKLVLPGKSIS